MIHRRSYRATRGNTRGRRRVPEEQQGALEGYQRSQGDLLRRVPGAPQGSLGVYQGYHKGS